MSIDVSKIKPGDTVTLYVSALAWGDDYNGRYVHGIVGDSNFGRFIFGPGHYLSDHRVVSHTPRYTWGTAPVGHGYAKGGVIRGERGPELINFHGGDQTVPSRVRNESGTEGTAKDWRSALVLRDFSGAYLVRHQSSPDTWSDGTYLMHVGEFDWRGPFTVIIDGDGRNVEAEQLGDALNVERDIALSSVQRQRVEEAKAAEQKLAEAVRGRETALRDLRASEQHVEKAEDDERLRAWDRIARHPFFVNCYPEERPLIDSMVDRLDRAKEALHRQTIREYQESLSVEVAQAALNQARESYREVRTDLERAGSAYKSARQRAWSWKGTAEALGEVVVPDLSRKIKKLRKQRDKARRANDARAAGELESLAKRLERLAEYLIPLDDSWKGQIEAFGAAARYARDRAAKLRGEK